VPLASYSSDKFDAGYNGIAAKEFWYLTFGVSVVCAARCIE
jgi:hypothetical protein